MIDFGSRLKEIRKSKGITQKQLAAAIGASERGIQNYELNERKPAYDVLLTMADYFDISVDYLVGKTESAKTIGENILRFMLYCDLSTMRCTASDINTELASFADSYVKVNDALWFFKYPNRFDGSFLSKDEFLFNKYFEKFTDEESIIFLSVLDDRNYYNLPDIVCDFLSSD